MGNGASKKEGHSSLADELTKLAALHKDGDLSYAEYAAAKAKLLGTSIGTTTDNHSWTAPSKPAPGPSDLPRRLLDLDCSRVRWLAAPVTTAAQDYCEQRSSVQTGWLMDSSGSKLDAEVIDIAPHLIPRETGLALGGDHCFGRFASTDGNQVEVLGHLKLPEVSCSGVALSCFARFHYHNAPGEHNTLLFMGGGWGNHFTLRHARPNDKLEFGVCLDWEQYGELRLVSNTTFVGGRNYSVCAVLAADGSVRLYVDGRLDCQGEGLRGLPGFKSSAPRLCGSGSVDVALRREQNFVGRWMRPDQSTAMGAGLLSLTLFDGELSGKDAAALDRAARTDDAEKLDARFALLPSSTIAEPIATSWNAWAKETGTEMPVVIATLLDENNNNNNTTAEKPLL